MPCARRTSRFSATTLPPTKRNGVMELQTGAQSASLFCLICDSVRWYRTVSKASGGLPAGCSNVNSARFMPVAIGSGAEKRLRRDDEVNWGEVLGSSLLRRTPISTADGRRRGISRDLWWCVSGLCACPCISCSSSSGEQGSGRGARSLSATVGAEAALETLSLGTTPFRPGAGDPAEEGGSAEGLKGLSSSPAVFSFSAADLRSSCSTGFFCDGPTGKKAKVCSSWSRLLEGPTPIF
mmetsp:Transcript_8833/g.25172  ORF Transcript_8833/g.25172 Transcript_8833/m.25172 type:complete len:238 (-) Transcript_8833:101-814(-)